jgi:hypothetical protein
MSDEPTEIADLLHRRTDLSTFVVHFMREWVEVGEDGDVVDFGIPRDNLESILKFGKISGMTSYGLARAQDTTVPWAEQTQHVVCFSEVPLEHANSMLGKIANRGAARQASLSPYGLAFPKLQARVLGVNPVVCRCDTWPRLAGWTDRQAG